MAVGSRNFIEIMKGGPGMKTKGRRISGTHEESGLREPRAPYGNGFETNNGLPSMKNGSFRKTDL